MRAVFVELPAFARRRSKYLDDEGLGELQIQLLLDPATGDLLEGSGGCGTCATVISGAAKVSGVDCA